MTPLLNFHLTIDRYLCSMVSIAGVYFLLIAKMFQVPIFVPVYIYSAFAEFLKLNWLSSNFCIVRNRKKSSMHVSRPREIRTENKSQKKETNDKKNLVKFHSKGQKNADD